MRKVKLNPLEPRPEPYPCPNVTRGGSFVYYVFYQNAGKRQPWILSTRGNGVRVKVCAR